MDVISIRILCRKIQQIHGVPEMYIENVSPNSMHPPLLLNAMNKQSLLFVQISFHEMVFSKELSATRKGKQLKIVPFTINDEQLLLECLEWRVEVILKDRQVKSSHVAFFMENRKIQQFTNRQLST